VDVLIGFVIALNISISVLDVSFLPLSFLLLCVILRVYTNTAIDCTNILSNSESVILPIAILSLL